MIIEYPGRLPGLNEIIDAAKQGKGKYQPYAIMKEQYTSDIGWLAKKLIIHQLFQVIPEEVFLICQKQNNLHRLLTS